MTATAVKPAPISGVSPDAETRLECVFPGVACNPLGRWIGGLMGIANGLSPLPVRLVALVAVGGLMAPLGALLYFWTKVSGSCFNITNRSVQEAGVMSGNVSRIVKLAEVQEVKIATQDGYEFHRVGDVQLLGAGGTTLLVIPAVSYPERLARVLLEIRDAHRLATESLQRIQARK